MSNEAGKTFIIITPDENRGGWEYIMQDIGTWRGRLGLILLWLFGVVSFKAEGEDEAKQTN